MLLSNSRTVNVSKKNNAVKSKSIAKARSSNDAFVLHWAALLNRAARWGMGGYDDR